MKRTLSIAAVALMMAGSSAFACGCGSKDQDDGEKTKTKVVKTSDVASEACQFACDGKKKDGTKGEGKGTCDKTA